MDLATVDLDTALDCSTCRASSAQDPETGDDITAQNGRFGPYLKKGTDTRSLRVEEQIFDIDLPGALELFAQPKYGARAAVERAQGVRGRPGERQADQDARTAGSAPTSPTARRTRPSRAAKTIEDIDFERAVQLLADKRAKGPAKPKRRRRHARRRSARPRRRPSRCAGLFLTFEGGDGSGKSTQSALLEDWLVEQGRTVVARREPGGTDFGLEIREIVLHRRGHIAPRAEALLYAADRAHHIATWCARRSSAATS